MSVSDAADRAFAALTELFSKPIKNARPHRKYDLTFVDGEPGATSRCPFCQH
jgi:hypothetical protein